jgi:hypothetical protein
VRLRAVALAVDASLRLSAQRALLGAVGPSVRLVKIADDGKDIVLSVVADSSLSDAEREALSVAATEIIADHPDRGLREEIFLSSDPLDKEDVLAAGWVFLRLE